MATIYLEPNEDFQHAHHVESQTTLIEGAVEFTIEDIPTILTIGDPIDVPANALHTMRNIGRNIAILNCAHGPVRTG